MKKIKNFTDLIAWQKNHDVVLEIYKITKYFPQEEVFGLVKQLRRSASSMTSNLAEGAGRFYYKDKVRFYFMARGSNTETQNHLILATDLDYITKEKYLDIKLKLEEGHILINALIKSVSNL